jgi:hypothetical protein
MFDLIGLIGAAIGIGGMIKEACEPVAPKNTRFDYDAYNEDIRNGITSKKQLEKIKRGEYNTTMPRKEKPDSIYGLVDIKRYNRDKEKFGKDIAEQWRRCGFYMYIEK